jgi:hypothetical protein
VLVVLGSTDKRLTAVFKPIMRLARATAGMTRIVASRQRREMVAIDAAQMAVQSVVKRSRRKVSMNDTCSPGEFAGP